MRDVIVFGLTPWHPTFVSVYVGQMTTAAATAQTAAIFHAGHTRHGCKGPLAGPGSLLQAIKMPGNLWFRSWLLKYFLCPACAETPASRNERIDVGSYVGSTHELPYFSFQLC